jgi:protein involved in polysaccharide export with SLBB domain
LNNALPIPKLPEPPKQQTNIPKNIKKPIVKNQSIIPIEQNKTINGTGNSFKDYVYLITGQYLERFGANFFNNVSQQTIVNSKPLPENYILDTGDELIIQIDHIEVSGTNSYVIDTNGIIFLPVVGPLKISGHRLSKAVSLIKEHINKTLKNASINILNGKARLNNIYITGNAKSPGVYNSFGFHSFIDVIFLSGGPNDEGSMRAVDLIRNQSIIATIDLYDFFNNGVVSDNITLIHGDTINYRNKINEVVTYGAIEKPAIYELKINETLTELIYFAKGLSPLANLSSSTVQRIIDDGRKIIRIPKEKETKLQMMSGDIVFFDLVAPDLKNIVTIGGPSIIDKKFGWSPRLKVSDIIKTPESLISLKFNQNNHSNKSWITSNVSGVNGEKYKEDEKNALISNSSNDSIYFTDDSGITNSFLNDSLVDRYNKIDNILDEDEKYRQSKYIEKIFNEQNLNSIDWEYALITRKKNNLNKEYININLRKAIVDNDPAHDILLLPGDRITIFDSNSLLRKNNNQLVIALKGFVNKPGIYNVPNGTSLAALIENYGHGLSINADINSLKFIRSSLKEKQKESIKLFIDTAESEFINNASDSLDQILNPLDSSTTLQIIQFKKNLLDKLKKIEPEGRLVLTKNTKLNNVSLKNGDTIIVPEVSNHINIHGEVFGRRVSVPFKTKLSITDYIRYSGGFTNAADTKSMFIVRASGEVLPAIKKGLIFNKYIPLYPGDSIVINSKLTDKNLGKELRDWSQILYQFALGVAGLKVLGE